MNIAIILASGKGTRLKGYDIEKQFIKINKTPVVIHTLKNFIINKSINKIIIVVPKNKLDFFENEIKKYNINKINIISGGKNRNESIKNAIELLKKQNHKDDDVILIHDGVRMFVSQNTINQNIKMCKKYHAVTTSVPCLDTIIKINDKNFIEQVPNRDVMYNNQTPQTFKFSLLKKIYLNQSITNTSDTCKLLLQKNKSQKIYVIKGVYSSFKITNDIDLICAKEINKNN